MIRRVLPLVFVALATVAACDKKSPTTPTPTPDPTRLITLSGDLAFGNVDINTSINRTFTIANSGNAVLTFTGMRAVGGSGTTGFAATPVNGTVPAGGSIPVTLRFTPTAAQFYSAVLTVDGDQTGGNNAINMSGSGIDNTPLWTVTGIGDTVFDMPAKVARARVQASSTTSCQNFIVRVGGRASIINVILGTCSVADALTLDSIYLTGGGGVTQITSSTGIRWTFTEVR